MTKRLLFLLLMIFPLTVLAEAPAILRLDAKAPLERTYQAVSTALEEARFWVVFEADLGASMAGFAERWGEDLNRNALDGIRSIVVCNAWYANQVSNLDPDMLALCPLHVTLYARDNATRIVFIRPGHVGEGSKAQALLLELEDAVAAAIETAIAPPPP